MFNVFFARSTDQGKTFPTVLQVSTTPSTLCFQAPPPPQGDGALPTTPDVTTCGTVQLGLDTNASPETAWVSQPNTTAAADIDFATTTFPSGSVSPASASLSASRPAANFTVTVNGFSGSVNLSCLNSDTGAALPGWLTCAFAQNPLNAAQGNTDALTITRAGTPTSSMFISAPPSPSMPPHSGPAAFGLLFATLSLIAIVALFVRRRHGTTATVFVRGLALMTLTVVLATALVSCGGSTSKPSSATSTGTTGSSGAGGSGGAGGTGGTGGTGGNAVTVHVAVLAQSGSASPVTLGTVAITAQ
jgi:hypothetical protein